jgi:hypothetical protein
MHVTEGAKKCLNVVLKISCSCFVSTVAIHRCCVVAAAETCEGAITVSESLPSVQSTLPQPSAVDEPAESSESKQSTSSETVLGQESCALPTSPFFRNYRVSSSDEVPSTRTRTRKPHLSVPTDNGSHRPALSSYNVRLQPARLLVPRSSSSVPWRWENAPSSSRSAASQHLNDGRSQSSLSCVFRHSTSSSVVPAASSSIDACRVHSSVTVTAAVSNNPTLVSSDIPHSAVASSATASVVEFTAASASSSAESMAEGQVETSCADDDSRVVQPSHASDNEAAQQPSDSMARQFSFGEYVGSFVIGTAASSSNPRNRMLRKKR